MAGKSTPVDGKFKLELDILIFTLVINLGFFKITEIQTFVALLGTMFEDGGHNLGDAIFISLMAIAYFAYVVCVGVGLYNAFKRRDTANAIVLALVSFFALYMLVSYRTISSYQFVTPHQKQEISAPILSLQKPQLPVANATVPAAAAENPK